MKKKVKSMKLVTTPLTWCSSERGEAVKREGERRMKKIISCVLVMVLLAFTVLLAITPAAAQQAGIPCDDGDNELTKDELVDAILPYMLEEGGALTLDEVGDAAYVYAYWDGEPKTVIDTRERSVTIYRPIERIICPYSGNIETLRSLKAKDIIVGIGSVSEPVFFPEFDETPLIGSMWDPDVEAILNLHPDAVILHSMSTGGWGAALEAAHAVLESAGVTVLRFNTNQADIYLEEVEKLGDLLDKQEEAEALVSFYNGIVDSIEETAAGIPPEDKPTVYFESSSPYSLSGAHSYIEETGGENIFPDMDGTIDKEEVAKRNPDIILKGIWGASGAGGRFTLAGGYELDAGDTASLEEVWDEIMDRDELQNVTAVKKGRVYVMTSRVLCFMPGSGCRHFLQRAYQAKWFSYQKHPELFKDLDPKALHQEYLTRFQGLDIDLDRKGVFVYPEEPI
jgi:iron complex transport system substrate-binding protein